ncbi:type II toxin-antitoxin system HipA family toxin [Achromobacter mucicolens]|uniref:type II toxin-antitoxin system HipA family toxin n=1 Tax=Achromobacter mucicolens TaxID=1389922 RepID=UPI001CBD9CD7|nr:type II toxin-antitoxin system HipA family toxin [Achromobacter mucicolens]UAN03661.1 type II toxin-antitoxin system HipA family toxin [Achromobacter mucicolens]
MVYELGEGAYIGEIVAPTTSAPAMLEAQYARSTKGGAPPPFLEVSLPEGHMRRAMLARLPARVEPDDFALLRAVGGNMIGLIKAVDSSATALPSIAGLRLGVTEALQMEEGSLVGLAFDAGKAWPGISGGFMKFLMTSPAASLSERERHWIVKLADGDRPGLCAVEYFGMWAARSMGLEVPETIISDDYSRYMVERFDLDARGEQLGFTDLCAISGAPAADKYSSSAERIVGMLEAACDSSTVARSLDAFFAQYLLASVIRNGDAHLKNFGLLYGQTRPATLSPVYDMLSMAVYAPTRNDGDADDGMALTLNGSRRWPAPAMLSGLARRCRVSHEREAFWVDRLVTALVDAARNATKGGCLTDVDATTRAAIARMLELWSIGLRPYNSVAAEFVRQLSRGGTGPFAL